MPRLLHEFHFGQRCRRSALALLLTALRVPRVLRALRALCLLTAFASAQPALAQPYTQISAGEYHNCALLDSGGVHCWGDNYRGQLGNGLSGNGQESAEPVRVTGISSAVHIAAGTSHNCAALRGGSVSCWGYNFRGQLGNGNTTTSATPVSVTGITDAIAVAAGGDHSCALRSNGAIKCWGYNGDGELGHGGNEFYLTSPVDVAGIATATAISARHLHTCALLSTNTVKCWGRNSDGQLGDGTYTSPRRTPVDVLGLANVARISAGWLHSCATLGSGGVVCWGSNTYGMLGTGNTTASNTYVSAYSTMTGSTAIAAGEQHSCVIRLATGRIECWGYNGNGRLGYGTINATGITIGPAKALAIDSFSSITAGRTHTCALTTGGSAKCWGQNAGGQIGTTHFAAADDHYVPQFVAPRCELDIDGDGQISAATDGLIAARALAGMSGSAVTTGALAAGATRTTWPQIRNFLVRACGVAGLAP